MGRRSHAKPAPPAWSNGKPKSRADDALLLYERLLSRRHSQKSRDLSFEDQPVEEASKFPIWLVAVGVMIAACTVASVLILRGKHSENPAAQSTAGTTGKERVADQYFDPGSAKSWRGALPLKVAEGFIRSKTVEERLQFVRDPKRVEPMLRRFFSEGPGAKEVLAGLVPARSIQTREMAAEEFQVNLTTGGSRLICIVLDMDSAKVDFECYARHGSVPWQDLLSGKAESAGEVRLIVSRESYYNFEFSDDHKWSSFVGRSPDMADDLILYAEIGSETERIMREITEHGSTLSTLAIRDFRGSHQHRQFEVTGVLARSWVVFGTPEQPR